MVKKVVLLVLKFYVEHFRRNVIYLVYYQERFSNREVSNYKIFAIICVNMEDLNHSNENYGCVLVICNPQIEEKNLDNLGKCTEKRGYF